MGIFYAPSRRKHDGAFYMHVFAVPAFARRLFLWRPLLRCQPVGPAEEELDFLD